MEAFDFAVIGAGPGGYVAAIRAAQLGLKTVLIEKNERLGGTCLNIGCIPSKALLESSEWFHNANHGFEAHGISAKDVAIDIKTMMNRKTEVVNTLTDGIGMLMKKNKVKVVRGTGTLKGQGKVEVDSADGKEEFEAKTIVLAMGSIPTELPFTKFDHDKIIDSTDALSMEKVPKKLIVIGAGAIGLEMGSVWARLGSEVTVVEMLPQIVPFADKQLAKMLQRSLQDLGITFNLEAKVTGAEVLKTKVKLSFEDKKGEQQTIEGDKVLVAVGRRPNPHTAGIKEAGVELDERGFIKVDEHWQTNLEGVYAIGDLIHGPMLAHKAEDEGVAVAELVAGKPAHVNYDAIPNVVYTEPELAGVGKTEDECKKEGIKVKTGKFYFRGNGRALALGITDGLVKVVADAETDTLLGVGILGPRASELIAESVAVMEFHGSAEDIARTCHAHPTLSEAVKEAALAVDNRAIHG